MPAITVKKLPPTNTKPARVRAFSTSAITTLVYDHALSASANAESAAHALAKTLGLPQTGAFDELPFGKGYVFIPDAK